MGCTFCVINRIVWPYLADAYGMMIAPMHNAVLPQSLPAALDLHFKANLTELQLIFFMQARGK